VPIHAPGEGGAPGVLRGCRVELFVSFEFRNAALGLVLGPLFESTWNSLVDAFVRRAREVYREPA
jgi:ribosome-associated toxin RatA of RatAB toxin-antitoxin module